MRTLSRLAALAVAAALLLTACGEASSVVAAPQSGVGTNAAVAKNLKGIQRVFDRPHLTEGRPLTFFLGGQFCPFCASMRWPLVKALARFGTFSGLGQMHSQAGADGFDSLATYDLAHARYQSNYLTLRIVEAADATGNPLQHPDAEETALINQFDPRGSIPFLFVGGSYVAQLPYSPALLQGRSFQQILDEVNSPTPGPLGQAVDDEADGLTAIICKTDGAQPASVCNQPGIAALMQTAP